MAGLRSSVVALLCAIAFSTVNSAVAADIPHPIVAGFERFYTGDKADLATGGRLLLSELNCVSCHQAQDNSRKQAPNLDGVANRVRISFLKNFLNDPHTVKPGTTMPNIFNEDSDKAAKIEALVQFLASTGTFRHERPDIKGSLIGKETYARIGCVACHGPRNLGGQPSKDSPAYAVPLGDLKSKYSVGSLTAFLENPLKVRPAGRMPHLVQGKDARDVANYLLQGIKVALPGGVGVTNFTYFEGTWQKLPDFNRTKSKESGTGPAFDLSSAAKRNNDYALRFDGYIKLEKDGEYGFTLASDDGSRLLVDDKRIVNNDGIHPATPVSGRTKLTAGIHHIVVDYFQSAGGAELLVEMEGPGIAKQPLAGFIAPDKAALELKGAAKADDEDSLTINPELVQKGKALFTSVGCANCHQLQVDKKPLVSTFTASPLAKLKPGGCMSDTPGKGVPIYNLSAKQKAALEAALKAPTPESQEPAALIARTMTALNCYACHSRDKVGGPSDELNKYFLTVQPEMGDEGRVPPPLDGVGSKINPEYLKQIVDKGSHDRPYMVTNMPGFGEANVGHLQPLFAGIDKVPATPTIAFDVPEAKVRSTGRHIVGEQALSCIKCHTFNGVKAEGIQGIDMTLMPKRVTRDWFHYYILEPQKVRPGTAHAERFPNNTSPLPKLLDGTAATQIEAIYVYLRPAKMRCCRSAWAKRRSR